MAERIRFGSAISPLTLKTISYLVFCVNGMLYLREGNQY